MDEDDVLDLTAAERTLRKLADDARTDHAAGRKPDDLFECYRLVVDELDRVRARLRDLEGEGPVADGRPSMRTPATTLANASPDQLRRFEAWLAAHPPPFAPELADAPLVTGESGALAPLVVDQPVHESTLPAELRRSAEFTCAVCGGFVVTQPDHDGRLTCPGCRAVQPVDPKGGQ